MGGLVDVAHSGDTGTDIQKLANVLIHTEQDSLLQVTPVMADHIKNKREQFCKFFSELTIDLKVVVAVES